MAQQQGGAEDRGQRVGAAAADDIRGAAVDRFGQSQAVAPVERGRQAQAAAPVTGEIRDRTTSKAEQTTSTDSRSLNWSISAYD